MTKVIVASGYGHRNVGDDAQSLSAAVRLAKALPDAEISMARNYPDDHDEIPGCTRNPLVSLVVRLVDPPESNLGRRVRQALGLFGFLHKRLARRLRVSRLLAQGWLSAKTGFACTFNKRFRQVLRIVRSGDLLYMSGGGHYNDIWLWFNLVPRMVIVRLFHYFHKPIVISGQGVGPLESRYGRRFLKRSLKYVDMLTLRNPEDSERLLKEIGVRGPTILSVGDDSHGMEPAPREEAEALIRNAGLDPSEPIMGVQVRFATYHHRRQMLEYAAPTATILDRMIEAFGVKILFFPSAFAGATRWDDRDVAYRVRRHMRHWANAAVVHEEFAPAVCKALAGCFRMFLGTAYHPCVFALAAGVPSVGLYEGPYYRAKLGGAFDFYGLGHCAIECSKATPEKVEKLFAQLLADPQGFAAETAKVTAEMRRNIDVTITRAAELLERSGRRAV
jgi:polysaccharide pyruvyl transferase WcaK-like protein